ncbi:MAG: hypothetical protein IKV94_05130 [Clostridia bacterium]|nr:hypothetical protein [Clostridia bacterium]
MKKYAYIFPDGSIFYCDNYPTQNHVATVQTFLRGLSILDCSTYLSTIDIFTKYYIQNRFLNYDDFAIFTLGWIKLTTQNNVKYFTFAGFDFQYPILKKYYTPNAQIDEIFKYNSYPFIRYKDIDFIKTISKGSETYKS